jgi:hypothetical protein
MTPAVMFEVSGKLGQFLKTDWIGGDSEVSFLCPVPAGFFLVTFVEAWANDRGYKCSLLKRYAL